MPRIQIIEPNHFYTFELPVVPGAEVLIGTAPHCQLALPGVAGLAEVHARIVCQPQGYIISDLGSPYGTTANGAPFHSDYLMLGVEYRMGAAAISLLPDEGMLPPQQMHPQHMAPPMPQQVAPAPMPARAAAPAAGTVAPKKTVVRRKPASAAAPATPAADINELAQRYNRKNSGNTALFNLIYVIVLLVAAVYAGVALRHWTKTGNFLPGIVEDAAAK